MKHIDASSKSIVSSRNKILWLLLISFGSLTYLAGYYFPPTLQIQNKFVSDCPTSIYHSLSYKCGDFDAENNPILAMEIDNLKPNNAFVKLEAFPIFTNNKGQNTQLKFKYELSSYAVDKQKNAIKTLHKKQQKDVTFTCSDQTEISCAPESLAEVNQVNDDHYLFVIKLLNAKDMTSKQVEDLRLAFVTVNPTFEDYLVYFKWALLAVAIVGFALYKNLLSAIPSGYGTSEQTCVSIMGFLLILFTQPFISHSALTTNYLYSIISIAITSALTAILSLFWFTLLERLSSTTYTISAASKFVSNVFALALFSVSLGAYGILASHQVTNPLLDLQSDASFEVTTCRYVLYGLLSIGSLWTLVRMAQIIPKFKELDWRDSTAFTFTFCYVLCYMFFMSTGSLQAVSFKGARVVLLFGITALYTLLLEVMYAPFEHEVEEADKRKKYDNPETKGQYGDLDASEMSSPDVKNDNLKLRGHDELQKASNKNYNAGESYGDDV